MKIGVTVNLEVFVHLTFLDAVTVEPDSYTEDVVLVADLFPDEK